MRSNNLLENMIEKRGSISNFIKTRVKSFLDCYMAGNSPVRKKEVNYEKEYRFKYDYFIRHIPYWHAVLRDFKGRESVNYLEVGILEGRSFIWMLENVLTHPSCTATGIDLHITDSFLDNIEMSGLEKKIKYIEGFSQNELKRLPEKSFDIIYIDGDHHVPCALSDSVLCWPLLKKGGILIFDDYLYEDFNGKILAEEEKPKKAIDAFLYAYKDYIDIIYDSYQCVIKKKKYWDWEIKK